jgi:hypothetical protein
MNSHIKQVVIGDKTKFELTINHPSEGPKGNKKRKRERRFFDTFDEAEEAQAKVEKQYARGGVIWGGLKAHEQAAVMLAIAKAQALGTNVLACVDYFEANSGSAKNRTLTLLEMVNLTIQTKTTSRRRTRYVDQLKYTLERFARGRETLPLNKVTPAVITKFLNSQKGRGGGPAAGDTLLGVITRLRTMFSLATRNDFYLDARANPMNHIETPYIDSKVPVILTPEQASNLL